MKAFCLIASLFISSSLAAQPIEPPAADSVESRLPAGHAPQGALWRALAVPGWGQIYNRQYLKLPLVYAGIGGVAALAIRNGQQHRLYTRAFQWKEWDEQLSEGETHPFPQFEDEYQQVIQDRGGQDVNSSQIEPFRDNFKRNRDLSLFGIGLVYGLSVVDALVSAHLLDFDVGEDLTVHLLPHPEGVHATLRIGL